MVEHVSLPISSRLRKRGIKGVEEAGTTRPRKARKLETSTRSAKRKFEDGGESNKRAKLSHVYAQPRSICCRSGHLNNIPNELILLIMGNLPPRDLLNMMELNKRFYALSQQIFSRLTKECLYGKNIEFNNTHKREVIHKAAKTGLKQFLRLQHDLLRDAILITAKTISFELEDIFRYLLALQTTEIEKLLVSLDEISFSEGIVYLLNNNNQRCRGLLFKAAKSQFMDAMRSHFNMKSEAMEKALACACKMGWWDVIERLLDWKNARFRFSRVDWLHVTAESGNPQTMRRLLQEKFPINALNSNLKTSLHVATERGDFDISELLLNGGADPNITDNDGRTALFIAAGNGTLSIAKLLLDHGAKSTIRDINERIPLHIASKNDHYKIVKLLLSNGGAGGNPNAQDCYERTPLFWASCRGGCKTQKILRKYGANPKLKDIHGKTAEDLLKSGNMQKQRLVKCSLLLTKTLEPIKNPFGGTFCTLHRPRWTYGVKGNRRKNYFLS